MSYINQIMVKFMVKSQIFVAMATGIGLM